MTLDYKGLLLLLAKVDDEDFILGGHGLAVKFCIFCLALRVSLFHYLMVGTLLEGRISLLIIEIVPLWK